MQNMPEKWDAGDPQHPLVGNVSLDTWWQSFNDPALNQLVTRARLSSPTIEAALLKIVQYRAQYAIAIGSFFPQTQELTGTYSSEHPSRRSADAPQPGEPSQPGTIQQLNLGFRRRGKSTSGANTGATPKPPKPPCKAPMRAMNSRS